jgi:hypothetical protein
MELDLGVKRGARLKHVREALEVKNGRRDMKR